MKNPFPVVEFGTQAEDTSPEPPNDPRCWAERAHKAHPGWSVEKLINEALWLFEVHKQVTILHPVFFRMEDKEVTRRPGCSEEATIWQDGQEVTRRYLVCYDCQLAVGDRAWRWFLRRFLPNHPEWQTPERGAVQAELERLTQPQMKLF